MLEHNDDPTKTVALLEMVSLNERSLDFSFIAFDRPNFGFIPKMRIPPNCGAHRRLTVPIEDRDNDLFLCSRARIIQNSINTTAFWHDNQERTPESCQRGDAAPKTCFRSKSSVS